MAGIFNKNPPKPKYKQMWDVNTMLVYIKSMGPNDQILLRDLGMKLAMLVALTTAGRSSDLSHLDTAFMADSGDKVSFFIQDLSKTRRVGQPSPKVEIGAMATSGSGKKTATVNPMRHSLPQAHMDALKSKNIISANTERKREIALTDSKFQTRSYKHINSSWTPIVHKPSNETVYKERRELVCNWFDMWSDSQRKRFLDLLFRHCKRNQLYFVYDWFEGNVPRRRQDFTRILPRCLSMYIFSYLDPRSLCRASQVSWSWKFVVEQDTVWRPKCMKLGWYLPYEPEDNEYGAWKKHYVACTYTLDTNVPSKYLSSLYGTRGDGTNVKRPKKKLVLRDDFNDEILTQRPAWKDPDPNPDDLERASRALMNGVNPNDPNLPKALLLHHSRFGQPKKSSMYATAQSYGLDKPGRKEGHRALISGEFEETGYHERLSQNLQAEYVAETRMMKASNAPWEPPMPPKHTIAKGRDVSGGHYPLPWKQASRVKMSKSYMHQANPRVIFISSRVPAADLLVDAVLFGVIPIVYEYEGTTLESLKCQLDNCLQGRNAQSIGIFPHCELSWELRLVDGATVSLDNLDRSEVTDFFETMANHVLPPEQGGHIDVFSPLGSTDAGHELLVQLNVLTGVHYSSPTGIVGNYNHVNSEWSDTPENAHPPSHYFCRSKLNTWANTADQAKEACVKAKTVLGKYFENKHRDVVSQLVGQVVFDAMAQGEIQGKSDLASALTDGLVNLSQEQNVNPYSYLGNFLLAKAGQDDGSTFRPPPSGGTLAGQSTMRKPLSHELQLSENYESGGHTISEIDSEVADINSKRRRNREENEEVDDIPDGAVSDDDDGGNTNNNNNESDEEVMQSRRASNGHATGQHTRFAVPPQPTRSHSPDQLDGYTTQDLGMSLRSTSEWGDTLKAYGNGLVTSRSMSFETPRRITTMSMEETPDRRTLAAKEILASEIQYLRTLEIVKNVYFLPLKNALASNRAIISAHQVQMIFSDAMTLCSLSKRLLEELKNRVADWGPHQCLGDIFVKFTGKLKAYVNFMNNYPMILTTIERCTEQNPSFRAFIKRHERTSDSKMQTLPELLLTPTRRVADYAKLLGWFEHNTPPDHADREDLKRAVSTMGELQELIIECRERSERERQIVILQKQIINCPTLFEGNRFLLKQLDASNLRPPADSVDPELKVFQHLQMVGLFLFNDALVVTKRTSRNFPFERFVEHQYVFEACTGLQRLRVEEIPDSKYAKNVFRMYTPRRSWVCSTDSPEEKLNWVTLLDRTIRAALQTN